MTLVYTFTLIAFTRVNYLLTAKVSSKYFNKLITLISFVLFCLQVTEECDIHASYRALVSDLELSIRDAALSRAAVVTRLEEALGSCSSRRGLGVNALREASASLAHSVQRVQPLVDECRVGLAAAVRSGALAAAGGATQGARGAGGRGNHRTGGAGGGTAKAATSTAAGAGSASGAHFRSPVSAVSSSNSNSNARLTKGGAGAREPANETGSRSVLKANRLKHAQHRRSAANSSSKAPR